MPITNAILKINESEYNILNFSYGFQRDTDAKGRPWGVYYGGSIWVQIESSDDIGLFRQMTDKEMPVVKGGLEEKMQGDSFLPMITTLGISPLRLDFNGTLRLNRCWPEANGWEKYAPKQTTYAKASSAPDIRITDAYWIDGKKKERRDLVTDQEVTLYVAVEECEIGQTIRLSFEDVDDMGAYRADCSGTVKEAGLLVIENFKMKLTRKEA